MWFVLRLLAVLLASKRLRFAVSDFLVILLAGDVFDGRASLFDGNLKLCNTTILWTDPCDAV